MEQLATAHLWQASCGAAAVSGGVKSVTPSTTTVVISLGSSVVTTGGRKISD